MTSPFLLQVASKFAMGNADEELKKRADFITKSIDEDGVALLFLLT